jgi:2-polyprenyl-3-methyl-5-hydroxy-6-metoxy-1,4-benzoquinol methylase
MGNNIGEKYDKIADWWHIRHNESDYGLRQIGRAISFCINHGSSLDVGCGSGGRVIRKLQSEGFKVTGIDASSRMIEIANSLHPDAMFQVCDICDWETQEKYDLIIAWDSIFHLPIVSHEPVLSKLCNLLYKNGILIYTFGDTYGEHLSNWMNDSFFYGSIGINENLRIIMENGCKCCHLELDQYPESHVYIIARKL